MVHYTETPERTKWIAGYYLFLCLVGFSILLGSPGPAVPIPLSGDAESCLSTPSMGGGGIENCGNAPCHPTEYNAWLNTGHSSHVVQINGTHVRIGPDTNVSFTLFDAECAQCHTTGYNNITENYDDLNVDCHACHDESWSAWSDYSGVLCANCHNQNGPGGAHPHLAWRNTAHANSLSDLRASEHASSDCMYCHSTEAFIFIMNPDLIADFNPIVNTTFDPNNLEYNSITCPACHAVHANWSSISPAMIRAENSTELCGICHSGPDQPMYDYWLGSAHQLAGVQCIDCHGYDVPGAGMGFMNHSFAVDPYIACGQSDFCHQELEDYIVARLEVIQDAYDGLTQELLSLADSVENLAAAYNSSSEANVTLVGMAESAVNHARNLVAAFDLDRSRGVHDWNEMSPALNEAHRDLLNVKATILEDESIVPELIAGDYDITYITETVTVRVTVTYDPYPPAGPPPDPELNTATAMLIFLAGAFIVGFIVGRRYLRY